MISNLPPFDPGAPLGQIDDVSTHGICAAQSLQDVLHNIADGSKISFSHVSPSFEHLHDDRKGFSDVQKVFAS